MKKITFIFFLLLVLSTNIFSEVIVPNTFECDRNRLEEINDEILNLRENDLKLIYLKEKEIFEKRIILEKKFQEYNNCVRIENRSSSIPEMVSINRDHMSRESISVVRESSIVSQNIGHASAPEISRRDFVDQEFLNENDFIFLERYIITIESILERDHLNDNCLDKKEKIIVLKSEVSNLLDQLKTLKENNQENFLKLEQLIEERRKIILSCRSEIVPSNFNCEDEIYALETRKIEFLKESEILKREIDALILEENRFDENFLLLREKYSNLRERIMVLDRQIETIKNQCVNRNRIFERDFIDLELCPEQKSILERIEILKKKLLDENNTEEIYRIRRDINFLEERYQTVVCIDSEDDLKRREEIILERVRVIETDIEDRNSQINILRPEVENIRARVSEIAREEREVIIFEKSDVILSDTYLKLDSRILNLQKTIENIEKSNMREEVKERNLSLLNQNIASLEYLKDNVLNVEYKSEFSNVLSQAREKDILSRKSRNTVILQSNIENMYSLLNKYFLNNSDYDLLKEKLEQIDEKSKKINLESIDSDDFLEVKEEFDLFKENLRRYYGRD